MSVSSVDIEKIYKENPNLKKSDIDQLKEWMKKQPHLPEATEEQLIWILHSCYFRIEMAKTTIDNYFTLRTMSPEIFDVPCVETWKLTTSVSAVTMLSQKTPQGYSILYYKLLDPNPDKFQLSGGCHVVASIKLLHLHQYGPIDGLVCVIDTEGVGFGHMIKCPLNVLRHFFTYFQEASPVRIKQIHYVNINSFVLKVFSLVKPFIKKELLDLIYFHPTVESLWEHIPQGILDFENYGGKVPIATIRESTFRNLSENRDLLIFWQNQKVEESKRLEKAKLGDDVFGVDGAFKRLEVD